MRPHVPGRDRVAGVGARPREPSQVAAALRAESAPDEPPAPWKHHTRRESENRHARDGHTIDSPPRPHPRVRERVTHTPRAVSTHLLTQAARVSRRRDLLRRTTSRAPGAVSPLRMPRTRKARLVWPGLGHETCSSLVLVYEYLVVSPPPCFVGGGGHHGIKKHVTRGRFRGTCTVC